MASTTSVDALDTALYDYELPEERIAQTPLAERDASRMLHVPPGAAPLEDRGFRELPELLGTGDLLVLNDTRVRAARLRTQTKSGGAVEVLVLQNLGDGRYVCLVRPGRRLKPGRTIGFDGGLTATIEGGNEAHPGARLVRFHSDDGDTDAAIERLGTVPLPPYIHTRLHDTERYQTVYAQSPPQSAAAPTAGLHFTPRILDALQTRGVAITTVRLEVGLGTFAPIRTERVDDHAMHEERFELPPAAAKAIAATKDNGGRVIAVGTTAVRTLESCATPDGRVEPHAGATRLFIQPGTRFKVVDGLLTNFHAPRSSLVVLVAAMIGTNRWRAAYDHALQNGYRFLSFGDCMLCWRQ
ncbi:MAG TPA: tRNA preQ1(34) S-adenosylmethionine ribosyltransferase-isomerase QueA [Candidatus Angelobacter sp.]|nr:tRNA preQ1(34) S-adenosylmethionine ribosyltransferase-isomerase QueA [Candidatus Angelobacter sp.]